LIRKPYVWKRKPKKTQKGLFDHLKQESKTEEWNRIREELKIWFIENGILSCELNLLGCTKASNFGWTWSFAHSRKRGDIVSRKTNPDLRDIQMREVVYACGNCHTCIEKLTNRNNEMYNIVMETIRKRKS